MKFVSTVSGLAAIVLLFSNVAAFQQPECHCKQIVDTCQAYYPSNFCWQLGSTCVNVFCKQRLQLMRPELYPTNDIRTLLSQQRTQFSPASNFFNPNHLYYHDSPGFLSTDPYAPLFILSNEQVQTKPRANFLFGQIGNRGMSGRNMASASSFSHVNEGQHTERISARPATKNPAPFLFTQTQNQDSQILSTGVTESENKPSILTNDQSVISLNTPSKDGVPTSASSVPSNGMFQHHDKADSANNLPNSDFNFMSAGKKLTSTKSFNLKPPSIQEPKKMDTPESVSPKFSKISPPSPEPFKNNTPPKF